MYIRTLCLAAAVEYFRTIKSKDSGLDPVIAGLWLLLLKIVPSLKRD
jgi:hypothetical protein